MAPRELSAFGLPAEPKPTFVTAAAILADEMSILFD